MGGRGRGACISRANVRKGVSQIPNLNSHNFCGEGDEKSLAWDWSSRKNTLYGRERKKKRNPFPKFKMFLLIF